MINILLVDDHDLVRAGLASILQANDLYNVIAEAASGEQAIDYLQRAEASPDTILPDVILMDINMPGIGGVEATRRIHRHYPAIHIIAVTAMQQDPFPAHLIKAGASAYVTKGAGAETIFHAISHVINGRQYLDGAVHAQAVDDGTAAANPFSRLSEREMQITQLIIQGHGNQYICDTLFLSPKTISTYRHRVFEKLSISNDVELTHLAIRHGVTAS